MHNGGGGRDRGGGDALDAPLCGHHDQPRLNFSTAMLMDRNNTIHDMVDTKPRYTSGSSRFQPRVSMLRKDVVAMVSGKQ